MGLSGILGSCHLEFFVSLDVRHGLDGAVYKCIVMHRKKYNKVRCIQLHVSTRHHLSS